MLLSLIAILVAVPAFANEADAALEKRGKLLFLQCRACHEVAVGQPHKVGPNLHGVMGREAATASGFAFSDALKAAKLRWDVATLERWLERPSAVVPGNVMAFAGVASAADRKALIAYLEVATK